MSDTYRCYGEQLGRQISRFTVLFNPQAALNRDEERRDLLARAINREIHSLPNLYTWDYIETRCHEAAAEAALCAISKGCKLIITAGGDDTVSKLASTLSSTSTPPLG
jgi:diacylglycerol kinase family enzyme